MSKTTSPLGYRPCVGVMLINAKGQVWIGRRFEKASDEGKNLWWQMPQGGIEENEDPRAAAIRELYEETGVTSATFLEEAEGWFTYDLPPHLVGKSWGGRYRGQKQKWIALRFHGLDNEINLTPPGFTQEFDLWKWASLDEALEIIVPFKKAVYIEVIKAFSHLTV